MTSLPRLTVNALLLIVPTTFAWGEEGTLRWHDGTFRLGYESLQLPQGERMGLLSGSYLLQTGDYSRLGLGIYGAVEGERGGFFTGGLDGALHTPLSERLSGEVGFFVGGGGGGAAPQGGGLMLRPYLGLNWRLSSSMLGLQLSEVRFPTGDISSRQLGLTLSRPLREPFATGWIDGSVPWRGGGGASNRRYSGVVQRYQPDADVRNTRGVPAQEAISLLGFEAQRALGGGYFASLAAAGAGGGESDGYAEVLAGLGWRRPFTTALAAKLQLRAGAGGGGQVDTGGGLIAKVEAGVDWALSRRAVVGINVGRISAFDGDFGATLASANIGYRFAAPSASSRFTTGFTPRHWQITLSRDSYLLDGNEGRKGGSDTGGVVDLIAMQIDTMLDEHLLVSGAAGAAYDGDAGGYAVGLLGAGWRTMLPSSERAWVRADVQLGVGGGGGLDVGGGALWQTKLSLGWSLNNAVALQIGWGRIAAVEGSLDSELLSLSIAIHTTTLHGLPGGG